ncbi:benzoate/H(+) symporter BenE family transporter [Oricola sp.]|uniref:benzoate/H(+) symporter BenE family transporter n=1 Tax=Oricola sp. TaxID=1979950 RepID=UPI0025FDFB8D|nr:benzoate/H(+) symporter BenE family transporter [Oricola sp.]MCI5077462.1 benzoate/H(+) symporter BenE family transporter [Oricola sp.]
MSQRIFEPGPGMAEGLRHLPGHLNMNTVSAGLVAAIFGCSGPALIVLDGANKAALSEGQSVAWLLSIYGIGGLIGVVLALHYRQPINGAYSIPGAALVAGSLSAFPFEQAVGAFVMSGLLVFLIGATGLIGRIMRWLPMPVVMAMIAGALMRFAVATLGAIEAAPWIAGAGIVGFFLAMRVPIGVPPVLAALVAGLVATLATGSASIDLAAVSYVLPTFTAPVFDLDAFLAISVPLALLVIGAENAQATGVLMAEGYRPPVNVMTLVSGIGGVVAGLLGGHNANIAGPMTAICSSEQAGEDRQGRYAATVVNGVLFAGFGLAAGSAVPLMMALPKALIATVAGLAMIGVLQTAFQGAFSKDAGHQTGALVALVVALSNITLFGISAPFWSLAAGSLISVLVDRKAE